jgi:hypothetical protein
MKFSARQKFFTLRTVFIAAIFLVSAPVSFAATLGEYREKIQSARDNLLFLLSHDESETESRMRAEEREYLAQIRKDFPLSQTVEFGGEKFEVRNEWLLGRLKQIEAEKPNSDKQQAVVNEIAERLGAIEKKLDELERQTAGNRSKDEDKQKLNEILNRPQYQKPEEPKENALQKAWREFLEWLESLFPKTPRQSREQTGAPALSFALQILIFGAVFALIAFLLYRFAPFLLERFRTRERRARRERVILGEKIAADETSENLFAEAERLARAGDLRAAIRKGYIAFLFELADRKIIGLSKHKTNRDYLRDVRRRPELHQNMNALTNNFERVWYGFGEPDTNDWEDFRENYKKAITN